MWRCEVSSEWVFNVEIPPKAFLFVQPIASVFPTHYGPSLDTIITTKGTQQKTTVQKNSPIYPYV